MHEHEWKRSLLTNDAISEWGFRYLLNTFSKNRYLKISIESINCSCIDMNIIYIIQLLVQLFFWFNPLRTAYKTWAMFVKRMSSITIKYFYVFESYCMVQETQNILLHKFFFFSLALEYVVFPHKHIWSIVEFVFLLSPFKNHFFTYLQSIVELSICRSYIINRHNLQGCLTFILLFLEV